MIDGALQTWVEQKIRAAVADHARRVEKRLRRDLRDMIRIIVDERLREITAAARRRREMAGKGASERV